MTTSINQTYNNAMYAFASATYLPINNPVITGVLSVPAGTSGAPSIQLGDVTTGFYRYAAGTIATPGTLIVSGSSNLNGVSAQQYKDAGGKMFASYVSGGVTVTGFSSVAPVVTGSCTQAIRVVLAATGTPTGTGVIVLPTATNGWTCVAQDLTSYATIRIVQTATTTTSATIAALSQTAGTATVFNNNDVIVIICTSY